MAGLALFGIACVVAGFGLLARRSYDRELQRAANSGQQGVA